MDTGTIIALASLGVIILGGFTTWVMRFGKVESAAEVARQALAKADSVEAALAEFKERVAREYATANMVAAVETGIVAAINRLGDRIDRILESRPPATKRTPSGG